MGTDSAQVDVAGIEASAARIATPDELRLTLHDLDVAAAATNDATAVGQYCACEWDEISDDGKVWIAAIVRAAVRAHLAAQVQA